MPGADMPGNGAGHHANGPGAGDQHILTHRVKAEGGVDGVPQGVKEGDDLQVDALGDGDAVGGGDYQVLRESARAAHAHALVLLAPLPAPGAAVAALAAHNVPLARHRLPQMEMPHLAAHVLNLAHKLVADDQGRGDVRLAPGIPVVDVQIGAADGGFQNPDQHIPGPGHGFFHPAQFQAGGGGRLDQSIHQHDEVPPLRVSKTAGTAPPRPSDRKGLSPRRGRIRRRNSPGIPSKGCTHRVCPQAL